MAEALFRKLTQEAGLSIEIASAGVYVSPEVPASRGAERAMQAWGLSLREHRARSTDDQYFGPGDLVLTMTRRHRELLLAKHPYLEGRVHVLGQFVGLPGDTDVVDPFGGSDSEYEASARELDELLRLLLHKLQNDNRSEMIIVRVAVGCDHAGYALKTAALEALEQEQCEVVDCGTFSDESVDYPDFGAAVAEKVVGGEADFGVVICGTGIGISIAANKVHGARAALCHDTYSARMSRAHNDANILALGARVVGPGLAQEIIRAFVTEQFEGGRHLARLQKIAALEGVGN
jgi:ribose 5-phosphate isomerase B